MLELPFTEEDVYHGLHRVAVRPENEVQPRDKPRASGLCDDARLIAYSMAGVPFSNPHAVNPARMSLAMTAEQGRTFEDILFAGVDNMDPDVGTFAVTDRQLELPASYFVTGHPDGRLAGTGIGLESKHYNMRAFKNLRQRGLWGEPERGHKMLVQAALYGDALGWESVLFMVSAQDASITGQKLLMFHHSMEELQPLIPQLKERAEFFIDWKKNDGDPTNIAWEVEPSHKRFPWSYSEYTDRATADGPGHLVAPPATVF